MRYPTSVFEGLHVLRFPFGEASFYSFMGRLVSNVNIGSMTVTITSSLTTIMNTA